VNTLWAFEREKMHLFPILGHAPYFFTPHFSIFGLPEFLRKFTCQNDLARPAGSRKRPFFDHFEYVFVGRAECVTMLAHVDVDCGSPVRRAGARRAGSVVAVQTHPHHRFVYNYLLFVRKKASSR